MKKVNEKRNASLCYMLDSENKKDSTSEFAPVTTKIKRSENQSYGHQPKCIHISPIPIDLSAEAVCRYFRTKHGDIKWIGVHSIPYRFAILNFVVASSAREAVEQKQHTIAGKIVNLSIGDPVEPQGTHLLSLTDNTLIAILKHLDWEDLCSIANVGQRRLKQSAQKVFASKYTLSVKTTIGCYGSTIERRSKPFTMECSDAAVVNCLRHFGSFIQALRIIRPNKSGRHSGFYVLLLIQEYCPIVMSLDFEHFIFYSHGSKEFLDMLHRQRCALFSRLQTVKMIDCRIQDVMLMTIDVPELILIETLVSGSSAYIYSPDHSLRRTNTLKVFDTEHFNANGNISECDIYILTFLLRGVECFEVESHLRSQFFEKIACNDLMKSLRAYDLGCELIIPRAFERQMTNLSELILGYPKQFTADNLFALLTFAPNVQKLIVISNFKGNGHDDNESHNNENAEFLEKLSISVSKRMQSLSEAKLS